MPSLDIVRFGRRIITTYRLFRQQAEGEVHHNMGYGSAGVMDAPAEQGEGWGQPIPHGRGKSKKRRQRERRARQRGVEITPQGKGRQRPVCDGKNGVDQTLHAIERSGRRNNKGRAMSFGTDQASSSSTRQTGPKQTRAARKKERNALKGGKKGGRR